MIDDKLDGQMTCRDCGSEFEDLKKRNPACPKCGARQRPPVKKRRTELPRPHPR